MQAERVVAARKSQHDSYDGDGKADQNGKLTLIPGELGDHLAPATFGRRTACTIDFSAAMSLRRIKSG